MKKCFYLLLFFIANFTVVVATPTFGGEEESGKITGKVNDAKTSESLIGVNVVIEGTTTGASTDLDGNFQIRNLKSGTYTLNCSYVSYKTKRIEKVIVQSGKTTVVNIQLEENVAELNAVNVIAVKVTNTEGAIINEIKNSEQIVSGVSSEQITKAQDKDASEVVKRVSGVTIIGDRFVIVRGLSERYNSVMLNDAVVPSFEADTRAFSFDVIPAAQIDRLLIYKTAAPELPGDFAGGAIKIFTKNIPDNNTLSVGYASSVNSMTTGKNFYKYEGGKTDWIGIDDGTRSLPSAFPDNLNEVKNDPEKTDEIGKLLPNNWTNNFKIAMPDQKFSMNLSHRFSLGKIQLGNITSVNYSNNKSYYQIHRLDFNSVDIKTGKSDTIFDYMDNQYSQNVSANVLHNWSVRINNNHKIEFKNFISQLGKTQTVIREGRNFEAGNEVKAYEYSFLSRQIYSGQLSSSNNFFNEKMKVDLMAGYSYAKQEEPDRRRIRYVRNIDILPDEDHRYYALIAKVVSPNDGGRFFAHINEKIKNASIDVEQKIKNKNFEPKIKTGIYYEKREREFNARVLGYVISKSSKFNWNIPYQPLDSIFGEQNINGVSGLKLSEITNPSDAYIAYNQLLAGYLSFVLPITKKININTGARVEKSKQVLNSFSQFDSNKPIEVNIVQTDILPSVNVSYNFTEKSLLRVAYGKTLNRPEFRELAPFSFYDFNINATIYGNDSLHNASIHNFDLRWELYPNIGESFSLGIFYKKFNSPIESIIIPGSGSVSRTYSFSNAQSATSSGVEVELKKSLQALKWKSLKDFGVLLNGAIIKSEIDLGKKAVAQTNYRPMQGQSPYIINSGIFYKNDSVKFQITALYNIIGPRIVIVGSSGYPDIVEMSSHSLDFSCSKFLGRHLEFKVTFRNIFNSRVLLIQDSNENGKYESKGQDQQINSYKRGRVFQLGVNYNF